tara:strand:- start:398 stop:1192 length:795 start_codon:yes stop_codon:yes gene_type:complete
MKNFYIFNLLFIGILLFGCTPNNLRNLIYTGVDMETIPMTYVQTTLQEHPLYAKEVGKDVFISLGGFYNVQEYFLGLLVRCDNQSEKNYTISPEDFSIKTAHNYKLRQIDHNSYLNTVISKAHHYQQNANNMTVQKRYVANSNTYSSGSTYGNTNSSYNTTYSNTYGSNYSNTNTTVTEQEDPWSKLSKIIVVNNANKNMQKMANYAQEVDAHVMRRKVTIEANSWSYFYLFFEKPNSYPIKVFYQDISKDSSFLVEYLFTISD